MPRRYLFLLIVFPLAATPAFFATYERRDLQRAARTYAEGDRLSAVVTGKDIRSTWAWKGSATTHYWVSLDTPDGAVERRVMEADWKRAQKGDSTPWFRDPQGGWGCSELERAHLTNHATYVVLLFLGLAVAWFGGLGWWQGLPGGAAAAKVRAGGEPCPATRNLKLPPPERPLSGGFDRWLRERYPRPRVLAGVTFATALGLGLPAAGMGSGETAFLMAFQWLLGVAVLLLAHVRGTRRDRDLWQKGLERHAVPSVAKRTGNVYSYEVAFDVDGRVYTLRQRLPLETEALPGDQKRIVILVDPRNPQRATVVPRGAV